MTPTAPALLRRARWLLTLLLLLSVLAACDESDEPAASDDTPAPAASTSRPPNSRTATAEARRTATAERTAAAGGQPAPAGGAEWTILIYLDADNDLEASGLDDFKEMATVGSTDQVNIVVQMDRISSTEDWDDSTNGDWDSAKRYRITKGMRPDKKSALADLGEVNMGDPDTLVDFVAWGVKSYPAKRYGVIFWDHGASWPGVASDDSADGDIISLPELSQALATLQKRTGLQKFDLLGFDACLMSQIDVFQAVQPYGRIAVGSADLEPGEGWAWNTWLANLQRRPNVDAQAVAPLIIKSFSDFYKRAGEDSVTLSAFDLEKLPAVHERFAALSDALVDDLKGSYKAIGKARAYAAEYGEGDDSIGAIDLGFFARSLVRAGAGPEISKAAKALDQAIEEARVAQTHGSNHPDGTGISVYFPRTRDLYDSSYAKGSPLPRDSSWDDFLKTFYRTGQSSSSRSKVSKPKLSAPTASADQPLVLEATVAGADTAYVSYVVGEVDPQKPETLRVMLLDFVYPPGAVLDGSAPVWPDEETDVRLSWAATGWYVTNGSEIVRVPFEVVDYGKNLYEISGTYKSRTTGTETPVSVEFEVSEGRGRLTHIWAFDRGDNQEPQPHELRPVAGDTFIPSILTYTDTGSDVQEGEAPGEPIVFGGAPLQAFEAPVPAGDYLIGLAVEDLAGEISDQYEEVTVEGQAAVTLPADLGAAPTDTPQPGAAGDLKNYRSRRYGYTLAYPAAWKPTSLGQGKVAFYDREAERGPLFGVDVYEDYDTPDKASQALVDELLASLKNEANFAQRGELAAVTLDGRPGLRVEYSYTDEDSEAYRGVSLVTTEPTSGRSYMLTWEAPADLFEGAQPTFDALLASFKITK